MAEPLLRTPLYAWHAARGARLVPFGGWEMPVQYTSVVDEHRTTRNSAGLFDISHMGRIQFRGPDASSLLDRLLTNSVASLQPGQIRYALILNDRGAVLDDALVYRNPAADRTDHMLVVNASNRGKILQWILSHTSDSEAAQIEDQTQAWGMIALQGPRALEIAASLVDIDLQAIRYYWFTEAQACGTWVMVSRTGYTGEDGLEFVLPESGLLRLWEGLMSAGESLGLCPCGLGARDTLRLEAAMPLYGHELSEETNPLEAGLEFAVRFDKPQFIGRDALLSAGTAGLKRRRVGLVLEGKRIAREGYAVLQHGLPVGNVTSGTYGPTVGKSIAMAFVASEAAERGREFEVDIRGQHVPARRVKLPFYRRGRESRSL